MNNLIFSDSGGPLMYLQDGTKQEIVGILDGQLDAETIKSAPCRPGSITGYVSIYQVRRMREQVATSKALCLKRLTEFPK